LLVGQLLGGVVAQGLQNGDRATGEVGGNCPHVEGDAAVG